MSHAVGHAAQSRSSVKLSVLLLSHAVQSRYSDMGHSCCLVALLTHGAESDCSVMLHAQLLSHSVPAVLLSHAIKQKRAACGAHHAEP